MGFIPIDKMIQRLDSGKTDSNITYFNDLLYFGEMIVKITTLGMIAAIEDERQAYRYRWLHKLVRASGIGDWVQSLNGIIFGPSSSFLIEAASDEKRQLSEVRKSDWQIEAAKRMYKALKVLLPEISPNWDGSSCFELFARLRNKSRGHGAITSGMASCIIEDLACSLNLYAHELLIFQREWAYLRRNQSGKYRVIPLSEKKEYFGYLKSTKEVTIPDGIYVDIGGARLVELFLTDADLSDFFIANGGFSEKKYELISYITGKIEYGNPEPYKRLLTPLPGSETDGNSDLDVRGNCFTNLPPVPDGYIKRKIEDDIYPILLNDRHPVITLLGRGGIGKTSSALKVIDDITKGDRYEKIIWFSARDIDLKEEGVKHVRPQVLTIKEISYEYWSLVNKEVLRESASIQIEKFLNELTRTDNKATLFVFDNFETVTNPVELYRTLDNYIRNPNKILITTRHREFKGDYPIEVKGMLEPEFYKLANITIARLEMNQLSDREMSDLFRKSEGHPYVVKIVLGEMSKPNGRKPLEQIIASRGDILDALFERTYSMLSIGAKRVFLTLCNWRSILPQLAVEAAMLRIRSEEDRFDPQEAIDELSRVSFIEVSSSELDHEFFVSVPLAAAIFGKRKLAVDQMKALIESDTEFLQFFGAAQSTDIRHGLQPRIYKLFASIRKLLKGNPDKIYEFMPTLEFIARNYPPTWLEIAKLVDDFGGEDKFTVAKEKLQKYLEYASDSEEAVSAWQFLADINERIGDMQGVVHALIEKCMVGNRQYQEISSVVNKFNEMLRRKILDVDSEEKKVLVKKLVGLMEDRIDEATATDCSRIAWSYLNIQEEEKAVQYTDLGLSKDSTNEYCLGLKSKFLNVI